MPHPHDAPRRGEAYWVDFNPARGSEQAGTRPAVVISRDPFNRAMPVVVVAAVTTSIKHRHSTTSPILPAGQPFRDESAVLTFQVMTVDQVRLRGFVGALTPDQVSQVDEGLRLSFGL